MSAIAVDPSCSLQPALAAHAGLGALSHRDTPCLNITRCTRRPPTPPQKSPPVRPSHARPAQLQSEQAPLQTAPCESKAAPSEPAASEQTQSIFAHAARGPRPRPRAIPHKRLFEPDSVPGSPPSLSLSRPLCSALSLHAAGSQKLRAAPRRARASGQRPRLHCRN